MVEKDWIDVLNALLAPTIAVVVAIIAGFQWRTNENKRKQDLFDKRWGYYLRAKKSFVDDLLSWKTKEANSEMEKHVQNYIDSYADEAFFLFGKDIERHVKRSVFEIIQKSGENKIEDPIKSFRKPFERYLRIKS